MDSSLTARQEQAIITKNKVFETTIRLFYELDFDKVTIRKICKDANVSIGTFYTYFSSKHDILYELYKKSDEIFKDSDLLERKDLDAFQKILALIDMQMRMGDIFHFDRAFMRELYRYQLNSDNEYFFSENRNFYILLHAVVLEGQTTNAITNQFSTKEITQKILRFSRGLIFDWLIQVESFDLKTFAHQETSHYLEIFKKLP